MTGLEKIMYDIRREAEENAAAIIREAEEKAADILKSAEEQALEQADIVTEEGIRKAEERNRRGEAAAILQARRRILEEKQNLLGEAVQSALERTESLPPEEYFAMLIRMAACQAHQGTGLFCLNEKDLQRRPAGFEKNLQEALPSGAFLQVSEEPARIRSGFLLSYGGIEENCSFEALLAEKAELLQDRIAPILFPQEKQQEEN